jgi:5-methyltetrahydropteroyltriglutamate--homocysteine methyltransferase
MWRADQDLLTRVTRGLPAERLALHVCRGNWTPDETVALRGDYRPLLGLLAGVPVGTLFLEMATPRAGELEVLAEIPGEKRIGVGVVNQKIPEIESLDVVLGRAQHAVDVLGPERVLLNPDCGFATFADNPVASAEIARGKLAVAARASKALRERYR